MFRNMADLVNNANSAKKLVHTKYPEEHILFASAATILETEGSAPTGWSLKRMSQKRGTVVFTQQQIFLKSNFVTVFTLFYLIIIVYFVGLYFQTQDFLNLIICLPLIALILQRLPYSRQISIENVVNANVGSVQGITGQGSLLTITLVDKTINIVPAQILPEEIIQLLPVDID